ncbi:MAG: hypothetical protein ABI239_02180 [Aquihabitans sp.]
MVIIAVGISLVVFARGENESVGANDTPPRARLNETSPFDHWHAAFAVNVCGDELPVLYDTGPDLLGIHTHEDGLIHIHPFSTRAAGPRATLKRYFDQVGLTVSDKAVELPVGLAEDTLYRAGETTCGGQDAEWVLAHWKDASVANVSKPDQIIRDDFSSVLLSEDLGAYTLAFVPAGDTDIAAPEVSAQTAELGAIDGGTTPFDAPAAGDQSPETLPADPAATEPGETTETAPAGSPDTGAGQ